MVFECITVQLFQIFVRKCLSAEPSKTSTSPNATEAFSVKEKQENKDLTDAELVNLITSYVFNDGFDVEDSMLVSLILLRTRRRKNV